MNDYKKIRRMPDYSKLRSIDTALYHKEAVLWLDEQLSQRVGENNVVITHHGPSIQSVKDSNKEDITTSAYVSNLESLILKHDISLWVHGHLHNSSDYNIGETRVICNPKGYVGSENPEFDEMKLATV